MCKNTHCYFGVNFLKKHLKKEDREYYFTFLLILFSLSHTDNCVGCIFFIWCQHTVKHICDVQITL